MAAAGRLLIADKFAPSSLAAVLEAAYDSGSGRTARPPAVVAQPV
jgi:hypothetical protein